MKTNLILIAFIIGLIVLSIFVFADSPLMEVDRINLQQLERQVEKQLENNIETMAKFTGTPNKNTLTVSVTPAAESYTSFVVIRNNKFEPEQITIKKGSTVVWQNEDMGGHYVSTAKETPPLLFTGSLESTLMRQGDTYTYVFNNVGEYLYHCDNHSTMLGKIIVTD